VARPEESAVGYDHRPRDDAPLRRAADRDPRLDNEIDLLGISEESVELRAEKLFKLHQLELKRYYDQTLRHSSAIFLVGIGCIILGFAIVGAALYVLASLPEDEGTTTKIVVGALGGIGAILANFIGAIYMKMFSETLKSLTEFHHRLVGTHHLHFGNFLAAKITEGDLRNKTLAGVAEGLAQQLQPAAEGPMRRAGADDGAADRR
jgi:hypothetical protein